MTAIAISETDPLAPAKILKKYEEKISSFEILAGYLDGSIIGKTPSQDLRTFLQRRVLIAKTARSIKSPL
jgi:large subunit ribosomal protein L10